MGNPRLTSAFSRYDGFKAFSLICAVVAFTMLLVAAASRGGVHELENLVSQLWLSFISAYWITHPVLLLISILGLLAVGPLNLLQPLFDRVVPQQQASLPADDEFDSRLRTVNVLLLSVLAALVAVTVPALHLGIHRWTRILAISLAAGAGLSSYYAAFVRPARRSELRPLASFHFPTSLSFDVASMGGEAREVARELSAYREIRAISPVSERAQKFLKSGKDNMSWGGYAHFFQELSRYFGIVASRITLHENTTAALRHALGLVLDDGSRVVTTDMEYGSVKALIKDLVPSDQVTTIEGHARLMASNLTSRSLEDEVIERTKNLAATDGRIVVIISHIFYESALQIDVASLADELKSCGENVVLVMDGAQAGGNVDVGKDILDRCHFYAVSGHKWLLSTPTIGILTHRPRLLQASGIDSDSALGIRRPFATFDFDMEGDYSRQSIDIEPLVSLNAMLQEFNGVGASNVAEHNRRLAEQFASNVTRLGGRIVTPEISNGIVSVRFDHSDRLRDELERVENVTCQKLDKDILRFSFHYYMSSSDVNRLTSAIQRSLRRLRAPGLRERFGRGR